MHSWNSAPVFILYTGISGADLVLLCISKQSLEYPEDSFCNSDDADRADLGGLCQSDFDGGIFIDAVKRGLIVMKL